MIEKTEATNSVPRHCGCSVSGCSFFTTEGQPGHDGNPAFDQASKRYLSWFESAAGCLGKMCVDWS